MLWNIEACHNQKIVIGISIILENKKCVLWYQV